MMYNLALTFIKLSILYQYYRLFVSRYMRYGIYIVSTIVIAYGIETLLTTIFTCIPVRGYWDMTLEPQGKAKCLDRFRWVTLHLTMYHLSKYANTTGT